MARFAAILCLALFALAFAGMAVEARELQGTGRELLDNPPLPSAINACLNVLQGDKCNLNGAEGICKFQNVYGTLVNVNACIL